MESTYFKIFFSKIKERKWLDKMGEEGYLLTKITDSKYHFTHSKNHKYSYAIEYLDCSPQSDDALEYYKLREAEGVYPILAGGNWIYLSKTDGELTHTSEAYRKNASFYFWRMLYLLFFALTGAILIGYQVFATKYLPYVGHESDGKLNLLSIDDSVTALFDKILNVLKVLVNGIFEWLNDGYLKIFRNIFGECDASIVIAFLVPIVIILSVVFALNLDQYLAHRSMCDLPAKNMKFLSKFKKLFGRR